LLLFCLKKEPYLFSPHISEVSSSFAKLLTDGNPEMKSLAAIFCKEYSVLLKDKSGASLKKVVASLTDNLKH